MKKHLPPLAFTAVVLILGSLFAFAGQAVYDDASRAVVVNGYVPPLGGSGGGGLVPGDPGTWTNLSQYNNDTGFLTNALTNGSVGTWTNLTQYNNDIGTNTVVRRFTQPIAFGPIGSIILDESYGLNLSSRGITNLGDVWVSGGPGSFSRVFDPDASTLPIIDFKSHSLGLNWYLSLEGASPTSIASRGTVDAVANIVSNAYVVAIGTVSGELTAAYQGMVQTASNSAAADSTSMSNSLQIAINVNSNLMIQDGDVLTVGIGGPYQSSSNYYMPRAQIFDLFDALGTVTLYGQTNAHAVISGADSLWENPATTAWVITNTLPSGDITNHVGVYWSTNTYVAINEGNFVLRVYLEGAGGGVKSAFANVIYTDDDGATTNIIVRSTTSGTISTGISDYRMLANNPILISRTNRCLRIGVDYYNVRLTVGAPGQVLTYGGLGYQAQIESPKLEEQNGAYGATNLLVDGVQAGWVVNTRTFYATTGVAVVSNAFVAADGVLSNEITGLYQAMVATASNAAGAGLADLQAFTNMFAGYTISYGQAGFTITQTMDEANMLISFGTEAGGLLDFRGNAFVAQLNTAWRVDMSGASPVLQGPDWRCTNDANAAEEIVNYRTATNLIGSAISASSGLSNVLAAGWDAGWYPLTNASKIHANTGQFYNVGLGQDPDTSDGNIRLTVNGKSVFKSDAYFQNGEIYTASASDMDLYAHNSGSSFLCAKGGSRTNTQFLMELGNTAHLWGDLGIGGSLSLGGTNYATGTNITAFITNVVKSVADVYEYLDFTIYCTNAPPYSRQVIGPRRYNKTLADVSFQVIGNGTGRLQIIEFPTNYYGVPAAGAYMTNADLAVTTNYTVSATWADGTWQTSNRLGYIWMGGTATQAYMTITTQR